ncbi:GyrI-like domain-containing protein [bacterium SCSIO 12741]|nr:GyrI-like domain-containing protein [bacterium SCSIO 12741]
MTKHEWRKKEKSIYQPKTEPQFIDVPSFQFITLAGEGNPNSESFSEYIGALYSLAYGLKMNLKKEALQPEGYQDFTVYPLEGVWDLNEEAKRTFTGTFSKDDLVFNLMIRQPDYIPLEYMEHIRQEVLKKKSNPLVEQIKIERIQEGPCVQMMHVGSYDDEPASFARMEDFTKKMGSTRLSKIHREIYLSDFRKVDPEKLKTILRFGVDKIPG